MTRGFGANALWKVADRNIDWIGSLVANQGELCLVFSDDDGDDRRALALTVKCLLQVQQALGLK